MRVCWSLKPGEFQVPTRSSQWEASRPASSASSRRAVGLGLLPVLVERPGGNLEHQGIDGCPVLAHQRHGAVVVHGDDGDGTGVADDEAVEGPAVGVEQVEAVHPEQPGPEELFLRDTAEPRHASGSR